MNTETEHHIQVEATAAANRIANAYEMAAGEQLRPSVLYRPSLNLDGNAWIALYGENLQVGVVGTGRSPDEAMRDFDLSWHNKQPAVLPVPSRGDGRIDDERIAARLMADAIRVATGPEHEGECEYTDKAEEGCHLCRAAGNKSHSMMTHALKYYESKCYQP